MLPSHHRMLAGRHAALDTQHSPGRGPAPRAPAPAAAAAAAAAAKQGAACGTPSRTPLRPRCFSCCGSGRLPPLLPLRCCGRRPGAAPRHDPPAPATPAPCRPATRGRRCRPLLARLPQRADDLRDRRRRRRERGQAASHGGPSRPRRGSRGFPRQSERGSGARR